jgi:GxxExxY protein
MADAPDDWQPDVFQRQGREERQERQGRGEPSASLDRLVRSVVDAGLKVHRTLGPGLFESVYEQCLAFELQSRGVRFRRQAVLPIIYEGARLEAGFRLDILVDDKIVVEIKSVDALSRLHEAQVLTYLRLSGCSIGLLMNFNTVLFKQGVRRLVMTSHRDGGGGGP